MVDLGDRLKDLLRFEKLCIEKGKLQEIESRFQPHEKEMEQYKTLLVMMKNNKSSMKKVWDRMVIHLEMEDLVEDDRAYVEKMRNKIKAEA